MKKPILLFAIKCSVILYFAACTGIDKMTTAISATPRVTKGSWKINLYTESKNDKTTAFNGCMLTFEPSGKIIAYKNGEKITGNWAEDDILKRITINLDTDDPALTKLNNYWNISTISKWQMCFKTVNTTKDSQLQITSL
ncbi:MAG: hypothetical protein IPP81_05090 [Chitinophagaceae bacterium]|nr:hypothetical protein [Chitinophagaceae bacterium]MBL0199550.1 hypothetical protein [Chitinophagaceae bacterium]